MAGEPPQLTETQPWRIIQAIRQLFEGRSNAVGSVTLTANATSTVVDAPNCAETSYVFLTPTTADASAELGGAGMYVSDVTNGQFTITHLNDASTDRTFHWVALG